MDSQVREVERCSLVAEALRSWGVLKLRATGISMLPALWPGDVLTIQTHRPEEAEPGEILLCRRRGRFFIHRLVSKRCEGKEYFLLTRGDCMSENDPPFRHRELLGKITEVQRAGSVFVPSTKLSPLRRTAAYMLCHWGFLRRSTLRLWGRRRRGDAQTEGTLVEAAS